MTIVCVMPSAVNFLLQAATFVLLLFTYVAGFRARKRLAMFESFAEAVKDHTTERIAEVMKEKS